MGNINDTTLLHDAGVVRHETVEGANTQERVGKLLEDIIKYLRDNEAAWKTGGDSVDLSEYVKTKDIGKLVQDIITTDIDSITVEGLDQTAADARYVLKDGKPVSIANNSVTISKNQGVGGNLTVEGTITGGALSTSGAISGGSLTTTGNATISGNTTINGTLGAKNTTITGTLGVTGNTTVTGDISTTNGNIHSAGNIDAINGKVTADEAEFDDAIINNTLTAKDITAETLTVTKAAHFFELVIDELKSQKGAVIITSANAKLVAVEISGVGDLLNKNYICYYQATDSSGAAINPCWEVGDLAICQSFNGVHTGSNSNVSSKYYWAKVTAVQYREGNGVVWVKPSANGSPITSQDYTTTDPEDSSYIPCYSFTLTFTTDTFDGDSRPAAGDEVVQLGYMLPSQNPLTGDALKSRQSAIILSAYPTPDQGHGSDPQDEGYIAPLVPASLAFYQGIHTFELTPYRQTYIDANGAHFKGSFVTDGGVVIDGSGGSANLDIYTLVANTPVVVKDSNNSFSPATITIKFLHTTGEGSTLGNTIPTGYTLKSNGNTITNPSVTPNVNTNSYYFVLYDSDNNAVAETMVNVFSASVTNGSNGDSTEFVYKKVQESIASTHADLALPTTTGAWEEGSSGAKGWSITVPTYTSGYRIWLATREISYTGSTPSYGSWQGPIALTGEVGADGTDYEFIYALYPSAQTWGNTSANPAYWSTSSTTRGKNNKKFQDDDYLGPEGSIWTDNPTGISSNYQFEYVALRKKINNTWQAFSTPALWAKWGEKGNDGDGVKYIFARFNKNVSDSDLVAPIFMPSAYPDVLDGNNATQDTTSGKYYIESDTPSGYKWYDENIAPTVGKDVYCSISKTSSYVSGNKYWIDWSKPSLWTSTIETYKLVGLKEVFEVRISNTNNYDSITGTLFADLKYAIAHIIGDEVTFLNQDELSWYRIIVTLNGITQQTIGNDTYTTISPQSFTRNTPEQYSSMYTLGFLSSDVLNDLNAKINNEAVTSYYALVKSSFSSCLPTTATVELQRRVDVNTYVKIDVRTVNLIFKPDHVFSVTDAALNSVYQGLSGNTTGSYTTGFSQIHQDWENIGLSVTNMMNAQEGGDYQDNDCIQYVFYRKNNTDTDFSVGIIEEGTTEKNNMWMHLRLHPTSSNRYVFYSKRTRNNNTASWSSWSEPKLYKVYGASTINSAEIQLKATEILSTVSQTYVDEETYTIEKSTIEQNAERISLSVEEVNSSVAGMKAAENLLETPLLTQTITRSSSPWCFSAEPKYTAETADNVDESTRVVYSTDNLMVAKTPTSSTDDTEGKNYLIGTAYENQAPIVAWLNKRIGEGTSTFSPNANLQYVVTDKKTINYGKEDVLTVSVYVRRATNLEAPLHTAGNNTVAEELAKFGLAVTNVTEIKAYSAAEDGISIPANNNGITGGLAFSQWILTDSNWHRLFLSFKLLTTASSCNIYFRGYGYCYKTTTDNVTTIHLQQSRFMLHKPKLEHSSKPTQWCEGDSWSSRTGIDIESGKISLNANTVLFTDSTGTITDKVSIDATTGTLKAVNGEFSGTVLSNINYTPFVWLDGNQNHTLKYYLNGHDDATPQNIYDQGCRFFISTNANTAVQKIITLPSANDWSGLELIFLYYIGTRVSSGQIKISGLITYPGGTASTIWLVRGALLSMLAVGGETFNRWYITKGSFFIENPDEAVGTPTPITV